MKIQFVQLVPKSHKGRNVLSNISTRDTTVWTVQKEADASFPQFNHSVQSKNPWFLVRPFVDGQFDNNKSRWVHSTDDPNFHVAEISDPHTVACLKGRGCNNCPIFDACDFDEEAERCSWLS